MLHVVGTVVLPQKRFRLLQRACKLLVILIRRGKHYCLLAHTCYISVCTEIVLSANRVDYAADSMNENIKYYYDTYIDYIITYYVLNLTV